MKALFAFVVLSNFLVSCNKIKTGATLSPADIQHIQSLNLLDQDEKIYGFYSEYTNRVAGNFFTNKRMATYWLDEQRHDNNKLEFAFYTDIKSVDTVYKAGTTYCPYMLVIRNDDTKFKLSVDGRKEEVKHFFEEALSQWEQNRNPKIKKGENP